jgi:hypothetical protein
MYGTSLTILAAAVFAAAAVAAQEPQEKAARAKSTPPGAAVEARLVAGKATYPLDLAGLSAEDYRKQVKDSVKGGGPQPPKVDLTLELINTSDKDVEVRVGGTANEIKLDLKGPGAETVAFKGPQPRFMIAPKTITLAPGKSEKVPIKSLKYGRRNLTDGAYWTAAGEYTLAASYQTTMRPAPEGATVGGDGFGAVTLTSAPIKIQVEAK